MKSQLRTHENVFHGKAVNMNSYSVGALKEMHEQSEVEASTVPVDLSRQLELEGSVRTIHKQLALSLLFKVHALVVSV